MIRNFSEIQKIEEGFFCRGSAPASRFYIHENVFLSFINIPSIKDEIQNEPSYRSELSDWENSYADSMRFMKRKTDFVCGRLAAKKAVKCFLENNFVFKEIKLSDIEIRRKESGEPEVYIKNNKINLSVSISHSNDIAMSAVSPKEKCKGLGVDIEKIEDRAFSFQEIAFSQNEIDDLKVSGFVSNSENITRYWTIKESVLKSLGIGLNVDLKDIEIMRTIRNRADVKINNDVMERCETLKGSIIEVESYKMWNYILSISCLK